MKKINLVTTIFIITLLMVIAIFFYLSQKQNSELENKNKQKTNVIPNSQDLKTTSSNVEWLTYTDNDLSLVYPKTFLGTSQEEEFDKNIARTKWEVTRQDNIIYIKTNFESPAAEFGSTYEIKIINDEKKAKEFHQSIIWGAGSDKNLCVPLNNIKINDFNICKFNRTIDEGLGRTGIYYAITPKQKTTPWVYVFDASAYVYNDYINKLLSSISIK